MHGSVTAGPRVPAHVAIIMDGNGRWAKARGLERLDGHRAGTDSVRRTIEMCVERGIRHLTLYSFSTENWKRSPTEVMGLMGLFAERLKIELSDGELQRNGVSIRAIGDTSRLPLTVRALLREVETRTRDNAALDVYLALSYGSREEIVAAAKKLATDVRSGRMKPDDITEESFAASLWTSAIPDPDLLIRTGGEYRVSNFLLWQIAYSEIVVIDDFWPDFTKEAFSRCLEEYASRERRFGMTSEQLQGSSTPGAHPGRITPTPE